MYENVPTATLDGDGNGTAQVDREGQSLPPSHDTREMVVRCLPLPDTGVLQGICELDGRITESYFGIHLSEIEIAKLLKELLLSEKWPKGLAEDAVEQFIHEVVEYRRSNSGWRSIPDEFKEQAQEMLQAPNLMDLIAKDIDAIGLVGESRLALLLYLVGTSRLLPRPLACIVKGHTASGKSYSISKVASLFPQDHVVQAHGITPQGLTYLPQGALKHRFVVGGERSKRNDDYSADATKMLREMLADGYISRIVGGRRIHQPGPIAFIESTTSEDIFAEDLNRCLVVRTDESEEQTRRIIDHYGKSVSVLSNPETVQRIILKHHALQLMLDQCHVVIPFGLRLAKHMPSHQIENRRAVLHVFSVVRAVTLLFQGQRKQYTTCDDLPVCEATREDYAVAREFMLRSMFFAGTGLSPAARQFYLRWSNRTVGATDEQKVYTTKQLSEMDEEISDISTINKHVNALVDVKMVEKVLGSKGNTAAQYRLAQNPPDEATLAGLPDPDALQ